MESRSQSTQAQPLSCPRCGCPQSRVLKSRRLNQAGDPEPLPALHRTRQCANCGKQFPTRETLEEIRLESSVWKVTESVDGFPRKVVEADTLSPGVFAGSWSQYEVSVEIGGRQLTLHTRNDMRVSQYPCRVIVDRQGIRVESRRAGDE